MAGRAGRGRIRRAGAVETGYDLRFGRIYRTGRPDEIYSWERDSPRRGWAAAVSGSIRGRRRDLVALPAQGNRTAD
jgi:hypothetical protein